MTSAHGKLVRGVLMATVAAAAIACSAPAAAQVRDYNVPAESASKAIATLAKQGNVQILLPGRTAKRIRTHAVTGSMSIEDALATMLAGTGLRAQKSGAQTWIIVPLDLARADTAPPARGGQTSPSAGEATAGGAAADSESADIVVTGTHIRGVQPSSPVISATRDQIRASGQTTLGEYARSLPQNFGGGQNPGVGYGATTGSAANQNVTGGSSFNLRGLGPDATLTLLNGKRLAYDGFGQAIDISQIPLDAVDRVDILLDGASALYGSDAVGGVANIILRRDFEGITGTVRVGGATDGGDAERQYSLVGGMKWKTGGFIVTSNYERNGYVLGSQRPYSNLTATDSLYPKINQFSAVLSAHQRLGSTVEISVDANYNTRGNYAISNALPAAQFSNYDRTRSYSVSPKLAVEAGDWQLSAYGVLSASRANVSGYGYSATGAIIPAYSPAPQCDCNGMQSVEADASGSLFSLPGGLVKVAFGAGYRRNTFVPEVIATGVASYHAAESSTYQFGEVNLPIFSSENGIPAIYRLSVNAALRHENYNTFGSSLTPKLGLIWSPSRDADIKVSWGQSFKAPVLSQLFSRSVVYLYPGNYLGISTPDATALVTNGGNPNLKAERANTISTGIVLHPGAVPGLRIEANYFHIRYKDRIITPLPSLTLALNSQYEQFITLNPTEGLAQNVFDSVPASNFINYGGLNYKPIPFDPASVALIVQDSYQNAAKQVYDGLDLSGSYTFAFASGRLTASAVGTWLKGEQANSSTSTPFAIVGNVFYPTHWRVRTGLLWERDDWSLSGNVNYVEGEFDNRVPNAEVGSQTTVDFAARYKSTAEHGVLKGLDIVLAMNNVFNQRPPYLRQQVSRYLDYDSTNYSVIGRYLGVTISKHIF